MVCTKQKGLPSLSNLGIIDVDMIGYKYFSVGIFEVSNNDLDLKTVGRGGKEI